MTVLASRRTRNTVLMLTAALLGLVVLALGTYVGVDALRSYEGAKDVSEDSQDLPKTYTGMLAIVDDEDRLATVTVFVLTPEASGQVGGYIVSVPVSSDTAYGIDGRYVSLAEAYADGGEEELVTQVQSVLGVTLDSWQVATPEDAATLLTPVSPIAVDLPADVYDGEDLLYEAGEVSLSADQFVSVLTASREGETDADRRPTIEAAWAGVAQTIGSGRTQVEPDAPVASFQDLVSHLFAGPVSSRGLVATTIADAPEGADVEQLDRADTVFVFASIAPSNVSATSNGLVFRIEAPPGYEERVKRAVELVLYFGGNVQSIYISQSVPVQEATQIELYDASFEERTSDVNELLGRIEIVEPTVKVSGVDVVLRLGTDFLERDPDTSDTFPSTTTTTTA